MISLKSAADASTTMYMTSSTSGSPAYTTIHDTRTSRSPIVTAQPAGRFESTDIVLEDNLQPTLSGERSSVELEFDLDPELDPELAPDPGDPSEQKPDRPD